ncbi:MAG: serine protein kinase RIO [Candidatus Bathyarchaeota archaeon]|nr:MAG: serine protein kinase RIO [Candidatus Bathyarchaeota archaeon]
MSFRRKVDKKLLRKEKMYEIKRLMKEKKSDELKVMEEVFDRSTLMTIYDFLNKGTIDEIYGVVKAGKEARIYWGRDSKGKELAIKIYLTISSEFRKGMLPYLEGDPRFARVRRDSRSLTYAWARKEFRNLQCAYDAGVKVPQPIAINRNVLIMEFIGQNGVSAPVMKEVQPQSPTLVYRRLVAYMKKLYQTAELVHADLSEYNVMLWNDEPVLFDVSQAVSTKHPMAHQFLRRDLDNLYRYFRKLDVNVLSVDEMYRRIVGG